MLRQEIWQCIRIHLYYLEKIENILAVLDRPRVPEDMNLLCFRLHPLKGE